MRKMSLLAILIVAVLITASAFFAFNYWPASSPSLTPSSTATQLPTTIPTQNASTVTIKDNYFLPGNLTVQVGTTVNWINNGADIHTTTSFDSGPGGNEFLWNSGILQPGQTYSFTFNIIGKFDYYCGVHATSMFGQVVVNPA